MSEPAARVAAASSDADAELRAEDASIAAAIAAGDPDGLARAYERYGRLVYSVAYRVTRDAGLAEDCTQEAFVGLWRQADRYDPDRARLATWLLTVVRNRAIDVARQRSRADRLPARMEQPGLAPDPSELATSAERAHGLAAAMAMLPRPQLETLQLAYFDGLTHGEIAERLGLPLGTVKGRIRLALERLRAVSIPELDVP